MKVCQAVIFDMDGVLIDSNALHAKAYERALSESGLPMGDYAALAGRPTAEVMRSLLGSADAPEVQRLVERKQQVVRELLTQSTIPALPGVEEILQLLAQKKIPLAVATGASKKNATLLLRAASLAKYFKFILTADDVTQGKPMPEIFLLASKMLGYGAPEILVLEDSAAGILAARRAGNLVWGLGAEACARQEADQVFPSMHEVRSHLLALEQSP